MASVIVIGGGLAGVSTAYQLALRGFSVKLLEAKNEVAEATSFANGGMLTASQPEPWNGPGVGWHLLSSLVDPKSGMKLRLKALPSLIGWGMSFLYNATSKRHQLATRANYLLADYSVRETLKLAKELQLDFDLSQRGSVKAFSRQKDLDQALKALKRSESLGLRYEVLDREALLFKEPGLKGAQIVGGIFYPDDAIGDARLFTLAIKEEAIKAGVVFQFGARVDQLLIEEEQCKGVYYNGIRLEADHVIVSAAHLSHRLLRPYHINMPIRPAKGYSATVSTDGWNDVPSLCVIDDAKHIAVVPIGNRLRIVGSAEFAGEDLSTPKARVDNLFGSLRGLYPHLAEKINRKDCEVWAGLRPMSADGRPFIGALPYQGLWINAGHGHLGWTLATGSALLLADLMTKQKPALDAGAFSFINRL